MCEFSRREIEVLKMTKEGVKDDKIIAANLGIKSRKQVAVHRTNARRKVLKAEKFYRSAMKDFGNVLFPGTKKKYKGI